MSALHLMAWTALLLGLLATSYPAAAAAGMQDSDYSQQPLMSSATGRAPTKRLLADILSSYANNKVMATRPLLAPRGLMASRDLLQVKKPAGARSPKVSDESRYWKVLAFHTTKKAPKESKP